MMRRAMLLAGMIVVGAATATAQGIDSRCPGTTPAQKASQDACQKTIDLFKFMAPQLGTAIAGGNATLGQGGTLGGIGHFVLGLRVNAVMGAVPDLGHASARPTYNGATNTTQEMKVVPVPGPGVDVALGVFKGIPLGVTNVGGVDLLASALYIPAADLDDIALQTPDGSLKLGFGARVGLLQESLVMPGIGVSYLIRDLPTVNLLSRTTQGDSLNLTGFSVKTKALRVTASKHLLFLGVAVGVGQDTYVSAANLRAFVSNPGIAGIGAQTVSIAGLEQSVTRTNYFADLSLNLLLLKVVAEIGQVSGGDVTTHNVYKDEDVNKSRLYGSIGLRFGF